MNKELRELKNKVSNIFGHGQGNQREETIKKYIIGLEAQLKSKDELLMEAYDLLVNPYDFSDRESDEITDKAQDYINKNKESN